jgi:ESCRT-II complex subunit VPS25
MTSVPSSVTPATTFTYPPIYSFPPFWTLQPTLSTRSAQFRKWSSLILSYCSNQRLFRLHLSEALSTPLFHNSTLTKRLILGEARELIDWMCSAEGDKRAEWIGEGKKEVCWIWWRGLEEWGDLVAGWVEETGQKNTVLTVYELLEGEGTVGQEFHGMDKEVMQKALGVLVKRGKAQVFGSEDQQGVKFF